MRRSDIFSLGVTFYEMLAGKHPFKDKSAAVTMSRILLSDPIPTEQFQAQVSPELQALLSKMLSKDKAARYQSAQDLLTDLRQLPAKLSADTTQRGRHTAPKRFQRSRRRKTWPTAFLAKPSAINGRCWRQRWHLFC